MIPPVPADTPLGSIAAIRHGTFAPGLVLLILFPLVTACATPPPPPPQAPRTVPGGPAGPASSQWRRGGAVLQGYFGAALLETVERTGGSRPPVDGDAELPIIGGGGQWKLAGDRVDFGLEGLLGFGWRSGAGAVAIGGGGAAVAVDIDLLMFELYGGPFASMFLGDGLRAYAGAGPLMQWAHYEETSAFDDGDSSGFGVGWYARTGLEFVVGGGSMIGVGARWSDSEVDLDSGLGDLELEGLQIVLTFSQRY